MEELKLFVWSNPYDDPDYVVVARTIEEARAAILAKYKAMYANAYYHPRDWDQEYYSAAPDGVYTIEEGLVLMP